MARSSKQSELDALKQALVAIDGQSVDRLYGLEPVYEPNASNSALGEYLEFLCPYCSECIGTSVELTGESHSYIEDCQVCCQPLEISLEIGQNGRLRSYSVQRAD
jgi:hypothetical protein